MARKYEKKPKLKVTCDYCSAVFFNARGNARFCSREHRQLWHAGRISELLKRSKEEEVTA